METLEGANPLSLGQAHLLRRLQGQCQKPCCLLAVPGLVALEQAQRGLGSANQNVSTTGKTFVDRKLVLATEELGTLFFRPAWQSPCPRLTRSRGQEAADMVG